MSVTTAVVLAAGEGTRLRPLTRNRPKPMLPAATRPILEHVLDELVAAGMRRLVVVVGYRRERVQKHFGPEYRDIPIEYVHQRKQLGSGHALLQARSAVSEPMVVVNGDHLVEASAVRAVADSFEQSETNAAVAVIEREDARRYGAVTLDGNTLTEIIEKPDRDEYRLINAGIYAFDESIFTAIDETPLDAGELALTATISRLRNPVRAVRIDGLWIDATYPWDLLDVMSAVLSRGRIAEHEQQPGIYIAPDARVHDDATLQPPVAIGADAEIGPGAVVGPTVAVGRNVTIGANATVTRSLLDADSRVRPATTLIDTVCGEAVDIGAATTVAGGSADVRVGQQVFENRQLGAVLADRVTVGGAAVFEPGTLVCPGATIEPGAFVRGRVPEDGTVVR